MKTATDLNAMWSEQHHITIKMAEAYRDWASNQGFPLHQSALAMSMAMCAMVDGMHLATENPDVGGAAGILSMPFGEKLTDVRDLLEYAHARLDELLKKGAS